jgi:cation diffusion facilitator CzcD-associated flavoprotein CzcO
MRVATIGAGVSGIATARVLARLGHDVTVFERAHDVGGVWLHAYPGVRLQNIASQDRLTDFDWPFEPDLNPTAEQILRYLRSVVASSRLDVRLNAEVVAVRPRGDDGWTVVVADDGEYDVDLVVLAVGEFSEEPVELDVPGRERFLGRILSARDIDDLDALADRDVAIVGFGKTAVDLAAFAADRGSRVHHVFRAPRWLFPRTVLGVNSAHIVFARATTAFIPSWVHPNAVERVLHRRPRLVAAYWSALAVVFRLRHGLHRLWRDRQARARLARVTPREPIPWHFRSAVALAPDRYYRHVRRGVIEPHQACVASLEPDAVVLTDGERVPCDLLVPALGTQTPRYPYLPAAQRALLEHEPDGPQLYRHILHPRIPRLVFAGYNHGFLHMPSVEIGALWIDAVHRGDLALPEPAVMEEAIAAVSAWKRAHCLFEPTRGCPVNMRFQQYQDALVAELGLKVRRKRNLIAEAFSAYGPADYDGLVDEYLRTRGPAKTLDMAT